jgi:preprotein translocase subunit YajC
MIGYLGEYAVTSTATTAATVNSALFSLIWLIILIAIFYFLLIRPQSKRNKQRNEMISALEVGNEVITLGGIHATIVELGDDYAMLRVNENSVIKVERSAIASVVNK